MTYGGIVQILDRHCPWWVRPGATPPAAASEAISDIVRLASELGLDLERVEAAAQEIGCLGEGRVQWPAAVVRTRLTHRPEPGPPRTARRQALPSPVAGVGPYVVRDGDYGCDPETGLAAVWSEIEGRWIENEEWCRRQGLGLTDVDKRALGRLTGGPR